MRTKRVVSLALLAGVAVFGVMAQQGAFAQVKDAKPLISKYGCAECHSIKAEGIKKQVSKESADDAPDLSKVGTKHTAAWITGFMNKKELLNGHKHEKKFKGTADELDTVAKWLESLKGDKK